MMLVCMFVAGEVVTPKEPEHEEVDGYKLYLSSSSSGYLGVHVPPDWRRMRKRLAEKETAAARQALGLQHHTSATTIAN